MKKTALFCISDKRYSFAIGSLLMNLKRISIDPLIHSIIVLHSDIDKNQQNSLTSIDPRVKFFEYTLDDFLKELNITKESLSNSGSRWFIKRYSHLGFIKIKTLQFLSVYDKIIFIDLDVSLYEGDGWAELMNIDSDFIWRNGENFKNKLGALKEKVVLDIEYDTSTPAPNGGFFIVNNTFDFNFAYNEGLTFLKLCLPLQTACLDELSLSYAVNKCKLSLTSLDSNIYNTFPHLIRQETLLCHFMGYRKPWNDPLMQALFPEWIKYYQEFLIKSNSLQSPEVVYYSTCRADIVKKETYRDRWEMFYRKSNIEIPRSLEIEPIFTSHWSILKFNSVLYYEVKFDVYRSDSYMFGIWVSKPFWLNYKILKTFLKFTTKNNKELSIEFYRNRPDNKICYIKTSKFPLRSSRDKFKHIWKATFPLRTLLSIDNFVVSIKKYLNRNLT